jgi:hypothetical protein
VDWIDFTCHGTLIGCDFVGFEKNTIGWDFHTLIDLDDITGEDKVLVDFNERTISDD